MTTPSHALVLAVPYCDRGTRLAASHTSKQLRAALADNLGLGTPARDIALLAGLQPLWSRGLGVWRCGHCARLWELACGAAFNCPDPDCQERELESKERALFVGRLLECWRHPNYGVHACTRCWALQLSSEFPGIVDRSRALPSYHSGIFTHHIDASGYVTAIEPHCIYCFGENIE